jgi:hypothetical protein
MHEFDWPCAYVMHVRIHIHTYIHLHIQVVPDAEHKDLLASALQVKIDDTPPLAPPGKCRIKVVFEPLKAVRSKVELKVAKASGGRWLFDFELIALSADIDDTIKLQGAINK